MKGKYLKSWLPQACILFLKWFTFHSWHNTRHYQYWVNLKYAFIYQLPFHKSKNIKKHKKRTTCLLGQLLCRHLPKRSHYHCSLNSNWQFIGQSECGTLRNGIFLFLGFIFGSPAISVWLRFLAFRYRFVFGVDTWPPRSAGRKGACLGI